MKNWSDSEDDDGDVSALAQDKTRSNPGKAAARKEGAATEAILPPVNLRPPPPPSPPKRVDSPSDSNEKEEAETMRSQQTKKQKTTSAPSSAGHEGANTDVGGTPVPSPGSWTHHVETDTDVVEQGSDPAPSTAIATLDMAFVMAAIDIGDGNKSTPQHISQVAARLTDVLMCYFECSGMALGEKITKMLHYKNKNKAGRKNSTDEKKKVRTAVESFITLMDSNGNKISWFPANNNKKSGVLMVTGSHYREQGTNTCFTKDDTTVWNQVTCSAHQSHESSTH